MTGAAGPGDRAPAPRLAAPLLLLLAADPGGAPPPAAAGEGTALREMGSGGKGSEVIRE